MNSAGYTVLGTGVNTIDVTGNHGKISGTVVYH